MKKLSVLLVAAAVAMSASAGVNFKATHPLKTNKISTEKVKTSSLRNQTNIRSMFKAPEGELKSYNRAGQCVTYASGQGLYAQQQDGNRIDIVYGENGKVYLKNIICGAASNFGESWVEGQISEDGTTLTVPMGQSIYYSDYYGANVVLAFGQTIVDEEGYFGIEIDDRVEEAVYTIDGDVITLQGTDGPTEIDPNDNNSYLAYGLTAYWEDDNSWSGFIEWNTVFTEREVVVAPTVLNELPAGCADFTVMRQGYDIYSSYFFGIGMAQVAEKMSIAISEDLSKFYIQDPIWYYGYGSWVEGDLDLTNSMITVPVGQFLNWSEENEYGVQLMWGSSYVYSQVDEETQEEGYYLGTELDDRAEEIQFAFGFNEDQLMQLNLLNSDGDVTLEFPFNYEATGLYGIWSDDQTWASALEFVTEGQTYAQEFIAKPAVPANPTADQWYDSESEGGFSRFYYTLPTTDVNGQPLDIEALSYSIYTDNDEIFTFPYENYYYDFDDFGITEGITEIPYEMYANGYDFHTGYTYFYRTNAEGFDRFFDWRIGIQVHYTVDGETNSSDIVYLEVFDKPVEHSVVLYLIDANGNEVPFEMIKGDNGDYTTTVSLDYDTYGYVYYDATTEPVRHAVDYYFMIDGVRYGANDAEVATILGTALDNELFATDGFYTLPVGYNYNIGVAFSPDGQHMYVYAAQADYTNVNELNAGKTVANVRYFNVMGQEMAQPEGMTIKVTTYTDGTTSAVKVMK